MIYWITYTPAGYAMGWQHIAASVVIAVAGLAWEGLI